jgi:hypothetical protein
MLSAWCFAGGTDGAFAAAGAWYATANMLDCGDGMLARLQNSGSPFGRLVDGVVDWAISVAIFVGLAIGLTTQTGNVLMWWLVMAGGLTSALHAFVFDYYQQEYISNVRGRHNFLSQELQRVTSELETLTASRKGWGKRLALRVYLRYMELQSRSQFKEDLKTQAPPEMFRKYNLRIMQWWTVLGATTNRTGLIVAAIAGRPDLFCWIVLIPGNLYLLFMLIWQHRVQRQLDNELRSSSGSDL